MTEAAVAPFPDLLRAHRERAGLTQRALADLSTISPRAIRDLEAGRANARTHTIHLLADGLRRQGLMREVFIHTGLSGRRGGPFDAEFGPPPPRPVNALLGRDTEVRAMAEVLESARCCARCGSILIGHGLVYVSRTTTFTYRTCRGRCCSAETPTFVGLYRPSTSSHARSTLTHPTK